MKRRLAELRQSAHGLRAAAAAARADGSLNRRLHVAAAGMAAVVGYGYFAAPLLLAAGCASALPQGVWEAASWSDWLRVAGLATGALLGAGATWGLARLRLPPVAGLELARAQAPALFAEVDELCRFHRLAPVARICLSEDFGVEVLATPRWGLPLPRQHTLRIGLPVLLTLSSLQVRVQLARRLGQASLRHNRGTGWLSGLRPTWAHYRLAGPPGALATVTRAAFGVFAPAYLALSRRVARHDELAADRYALDLLNDEDVVEGICAALVAERFLQERFWPKLRALAARPGGATPLPYETMARVYRRGLAKDDARAWLQAALAAPAAALLPPLGERLHELGHDTPVPPCPPEAPAAATLLGDRLAAVLARFDRRWQRRHTPATRRAHRAPPRDLKQAG